MTYKYKQEYVENYIQLHSGKRFYINYPRVEDIDMDDIAHALSNICRFTGHGNRFYSVAEHSIYCANVAKSLGLSTLMQLYALLHDASEAIMNDLARPIKQNIPQYIDIEHKVMSVLWKVAKVPKPTKDDYKIIKLIDNTMLINEMSQLMKNFEIPKVEYFEVFFDLKKGYNAGEAKEPFLFLYKYLLDQYNTYEK